MRRFRIALLAALAGGLVIAGALATWVSLFAGLQHLTGTTGVHGRVLLAGGIALVVFAIVEIRLRSDVMRWATGLLGGLLLLPAGLGILGQHAIATLDPLLAATAGPGPWIAAAGAALAMLGLFLPPTPSTTAGIDNDVRSPAPPGR